MAVRHVRARATSLPTGIVSLVAIAVHVVANLVLSAASNPAVNGEVLGKGAPVVDNNVGEVAMKVAGHVVLNVNGRDHLGMTLMSIPEPSQSSQ